MRLVSKSFALLFVVCLATPLLSACNTEEPIEPEVEGPGQRGCGEAVVYIGMPLADVPLDQFNPNRVFEEGARVTMDFDPTRTNIVYDVEKIVVQAYCG
jgi:hypothetical protein